MDKYVLAIFIGFCSYLEVAVSRSNACSETSLSSNNNGNHLNGNPNINVVCYLSIGEKFQGSIPPAANVTLCTHIIMLGSTNRGGKVAPTHDYDEEYYYKSVAEMKRRNPKLKVLLSNGGQFSPTMLSNTSRFSYAESIIPYLVKYQFDGFDMDWEFPAWYGRPKSQRHNLTLILQTIRGVFDRYTQQRNISKFLLTSAVASTNPLIDDCYEPAKISKYLDFINLMSYDIHGFSVDTPFTGYNSPLYSGSSILDKTIFLKNNLADAAKQWFEKGMPKEKIMVGVPVYGHTFELLFEKWHSVYSLAVGYSKALGDEINRALICKLLKTYTEVWDDECKVPYAYSGKTWVSYDNEKSVALKAKWIKDNGYGGVMTYSLDSDDYTGACSNIRWPIHLAIVNALKES